MLDANILIRAVLGAKVPALINDHAADVVFLTAEEAFNDASTYLPRVLERRGVDQATEQVALEKLEALRRIVRTVSDDAYTHLEASARERLKRRDEDDWPYLALALLLDCPIWTEDTDFFGCGAAVWTTDRVGLYLQS